MVHAASDSPPRPRVLLLGPCELHADRVVAFAPERRYQLLVLLALRGGEWIPRDQLAALLWPDRPTAEARRNLRKVVFDARAVPGAAGLQATEHALRWEVASDLRELDQAVREGRFGDAAGLRRGAALAGIGGPESGALAEWLAAERSRIEQAWHAAALAELRALADPQARAHAARRLLEVDACDESAAAALIAAELALGRRVDAHAVYRQYAQRLAEELGVEPSQALRDLLREADAERVAAGAPPVRGPSPAPGATGRGDAGAFVGRRLELAELARLLAEPQGRLLTVLGPGGIGKSRLARQVMRGRAAGFEDGWQWVELEDLSDISGVVARVARTLGVTPVGSDDPVRPLLRHLGDARRCLVLDNAEHLDGLPGLLQRLLDGAPGLRLLVTSRHRLALRGEWVLPLVGLAVPDEDSRDLEAATAFDAVRLFEVRARVAQHDFDLAAHLDAVIDIVDAVAGMPLAIELAAGWMRLLPAEQVAQDLRGSIDLLERDPAAPDPPARAEHASLRAVLDGTWRLLAPREREALAALAVFEGGFARGAALAIAGCSLPLLSALVDRSLLAVDGAGRFALHPVVRAYAAERLAAQPERSQALRIAHAEHFARELARAAPGGGGDRQRLIDTFGAAEADHLQAWRVALEAGRADLLAALALPLQACLEARGRFSDGIALLRGALQLPARDAAATQALARVRQALALLQFRHHEFDAARRTAQAGLALAEACADRRAIAGCLHVIGSSWSSAGRPAVALPWFERALAVAREDGHPRGIATVLGSLGIVAKQQGRFDDALRLYREALAIDREIGDPLTLAMRLNSLGSLHAERDEWAAARRWYEEGLDLAETLGVGWLRAQLGYGVGLAHAELGLLDSAGKQLRQAREAARAGELRGIAVACEGMLGRVAILAGDQAAALGHLKAAAEQARRLDDIVERLTVLLFFGDWLRAAGRPVAAAQVWQLVAGHEAAEAGLRASAERWLGGLPAVPMATAAPPDLDVDGAEAWLDRAS